MCPTALRPRPPKVSVNAPGSAGSSLVTSESGRADWADATAARPTRAAQADIIDRVVAAAVGRFFPFGVMIMDPVLPVSFGWFLRPSPVSVPRSARPRLEPNLRRADGPTRRWSERQGRYQHPRTAPRASTARLMSECRVDLPLLANCAGYSSDDKFLTAVDGHEARLALGHLSV